LDDLLIVPLGIWLAVKMIPPELMAEFRAAAAQQSRPVSWKGAVFVGLVWVLAVAIAVFMVMCWKRK
jgi:hypothetical protein